MFEATASGWYWTNITAKASAFANGDNDRLAAVAFARWLSESEVEFHWHPTSLRFDIGFGAWEDVAVKASTLEDAGRVLIAPPIAAYTFAVRLAPPIVCIHGCTYQSRWAELIERHPDGVPVGQLLTAADWLRSFPHHWTPCAEVAQAKALAAGAAG